MLNKSKYLWSVFQGSGVYAVNGTVPDYISSIFNNDTEELQGKSCQLPIIVPQDGNQIVQTPGTESCETFVERFVSSNGTFTRCDICYRVIQVVLELGWVDLYLRCSNSLLGQSVATVAAH